MELRGLSSGVPIWGTARVGPISQIHASLGYSSGSFSLSYEKGPNLDKLYETYNIKDARTHACVCVCVNQREIALLYKSYWPYEHPLQ